MSGVRINRFLASCGLGSRRACEEIVRTGRVVLNGRRVDSLAARVGPGDQVLVDGEPVRPDREMVVVLHKPRGILCTRADPRARETVYDLLPAELRHLAHVGRLDRESEGLLVLTNSGDLAQALTHPATKIEKEYIVQLDAPLTPKDRAAFLRGIETEEGLAQAAEVEIVQPRIVRIVLRQGLKRQIRLMCAAVGLDVKRLVRVRIGSFTAPRLAVGRWRKLTGREIALLRANPQTARPGPAVAAPPPLRRKGPAARPTSTRGRRPASPPPGKSRSAPAKPAKPGKPAPPRRPARGGTAATRGGGRPAKPVSRPSAKKRSPRRKGI